MTTAHTTDPDAWQPRAARAPSVSIDADTAASLDPPSRYDQLTPSSPEAVESPADTPDPAEPPTDSRPAGPAGPAETVQARLQARLEAIEAGPDSHADTPRARRTAALEAKPLPGEVADLHEQLDVLRSQLEAAFDDVDHRIAAASERAAAAEARVRLVETEFLGILNQLMSKLPQIVGPGRLEDLRDLRKSIDRLRDRLSP